MSPLPVFTAVTLLPVPLILGAALWGGLWGVAALVYMMVLIATLDEMIAWVLPNSSGEEFPTADGLSLTLVAAHFLILGCTVGALAGDDLGLLSKVALFCAAGFWFGQVSNSNAHELIHRQSRLLRRLGIAVYVSLLFGHHASAHLHVHHPMVGTRDDPNTARRGENLYHFASRAWRGSFKAGWIAETARRKRAGRAAWRHPYLGYLVGACLFVAAAVGLGGLKGVLAYVGIAAFAQFQLMMSDFVQHYGLMRDMDANGKPEPVNPSHSWNSPHWASSALMLNAPRHSDHHARPARPYPDLELTDGPMLPRSLPVMASIALFPPLWRRVMAPHLEGLK